MDYEKNKNKILAVLLIGVLMGALDIAIVGPAIPAIEKTISITQKSTGWIFSIFVLFNLLGISLLAKLSDIFGRRIIYIISLVIFGIGSLFVSLSNTYELLLIGRAIQGFGASGILPVASAVIGDIFPPDKRGKILGMVGAVFGLAFVIGPVLAGVILSFFHWNTLFLINIPIVIALVFGAKLLPNVRIADKKSFDWKGILFLGITLSSFTLAVNNILSTNLINSILSIKVLPFLLVSIIFLFAFIFIEKRTTFPIIKTSLFSIRQVNIVVFIALGIGFVQSFTVFIPDMLVTIKHIETSKASFMLLPIVFATVIGAPLSGRMLDKYGSKIVIITGLIFIIIGFFLMSFKLDSTINFYISGAISGFGLSFLSGPSLRYVMLNEVSATERATSQGLVTIFTSIGQIIGSAVISGITAEYAGLPKGYIISMYLLVIMIILFLIASFWLKNKELEIKTIK